MEQLIVPVQPLECDQESDVCYHNMCMAIEDLVEELELVWIARLSSHKSEVSAYEIEHHI